MSFEKQSKVDNNEKESDQDFIDIKDSILKKISNANSVEDLKTVAEEIRKLDESSDSQESNLENPQEIERLQKKIEELEKKVYYDEMTGLLNRRGFQKEIESRFIDALNQVPENEQRSKPVEPINIIFADLNDFKPINDRYGHAVGDKILTAVSENLIKGLRESDVVARIGGDEFLIAFTGNKKVHEVVKYKIKKIIENTKVFFENEELSVGVSVGGAVNDLNKDISQTIKSADLAMYEQKKEGGR
jgi:diguanylate cyclase (GGDEF)-like protein